MKDRNRDHVARDLKGVRYWKVEAVGRRYEGRRMDDSWRKHPSCRVSLELGTHGDCPITQKGEVGI